ncbi:dTDP-glucose 4,6-dehydratase [Marinospirillum celere]|uniref:dTDP-glucose 4,6-dehydratase n=1 Tax=Marinospirillum celere TaxID=1122252 RepID=A0A1I1GVG1_9GAMM|nr:GDP-mannose 4,6-dehydratase [Marinospirillum celere]SFC13838.1 dTDP-glucose 4,6-dehydratase [Marinospirillum celere]
MKLLITGGAGFVGSALIHWLLQNTEHQVINFDKRTPAANPLSLQSIRRHKDYTSFRGDVCDPDRIAEALEKFQPDAVIHLAAATPDEAEGRAYTASEAYMQTQCIGTFHLLEATRHYWQQLPAHKHRDFRFLQVSSDVVFGNQQKLTNTLAESNSYQPDSPYSASKASADQLVKAWQACYQLPILVTYSCCNYGPRQHPSQLLPALVIKALNQQPLLIPSTNQAIKDWLYVEDHVRALYQVLLSGRPGESYHISSNEPLSRHQLLNQVCHQLDELQPAATSYCNLITYDTCLPDYQTYLSLDTTKIRSELGWQPLDNFSSGLRKTMTWYLNNSAWVNKALERSQPKAIRRKKVTQGI